MVDNMRINVQRKARTMIEMNRKIKTNIKSEV